MNKLNLTEKEKTKLRELDLALSTIKLPLRPPGAFNLFLNE